VIGSTYPLFVRIISSVTLLSWLWRPTSALMGALDVINDKELEMLKTPSMGLLDVCIVPVRAKIDFVHLQNEG
jgi:hypothetical protein